MAVGGEYLISILGLQNSPCPPVSETALMEAGGVDEERCIFGLQRSPTSAVAETALMDAGAVDEEKCIFGLQSSPPPAVAETPAELQDAATDQGV
jgi:hypothetical protein